MTSTAAPEAGHRLAASAAVERACRLLLAYQDPEGCWPDGAVADASIAAEGLLALEFLRVRSAPATSAAARRIRSVQQPDGRWAGAEPGAAADVSASVLAYLALRLAGDPPDAFHMAAAAGWIRDAGGVGGVGVSGLAWLALFGLAEWDNVPVPALDVRHLLVRETPDVATWSRLTAVTLAIIGTLRPDRPRPANLLELETGEPLVSLIARSRQSAPSRAKAVTRLAWLHRCGGWLADWQLHAADAEAGRPLWPLCLVALHALGYPPSHPAQAAGLARLDEDLTGLDGRGPDLSPVAHTALAAQALTAAGLPDGSPGLLAAGRWLLRRRTRVTAPGPAAHASPAPGGWSFCPDGYPRPADTACVLIALTGVDLRAISGWRAVEEAAGWLAGTQGRDGSWAGSAMLTAYCVQALASQPLRQTSTARAIRRGTTWLLRAQLPHGGWPGRQGGTDLLATTVAVIGLRAAGVLAHKPSVTGSVGWLVAQQNPDGGWHAGDVNERPGRGGSDAVGTAHALAALLAARGDAAVHGDEAAAWLIGAQLPDGSWPAPAAAADAGLPERLRPHAGRSPVASVLLPLAALGRYVHADEAPH